MAEKNQTLIAPITHVNEITRLAIGSEIIQGLLVSPNDIRIDGRFFGKIITKGKVVIGEQAYIKGEIICSNADISGKMEGTITVGDILALMSTSEYIGLLQAVKLSIEKSAKFNGTCKIISQDDFNRIYGEEEKKIKKSQTESEPDEKK